MKNLQKKLCKNTFILHEIFRLALDLKINPFKLDVNDVNEHYYFNEFRL